MAKALKLRPLDDRVVVEPMEAEERTAGGIVLPDTAKESRSAERSFPSDRASCWIAASAARFPSPSAMK
jgi:hypothetical protein